MTIEYTTGATVHFPNEGKYVLATNEHGELKLPLVVALGHVPEVCEAMMTLAGHEWPVKRSAEDLAQQSIDRMNAQIATEKAVAERIIARLEKYRAGHHLIHGDFTDGLVAAYQTAEQLVREECGVAE